MPASPTVPFGWGTALSASPRGWPSPCRPASTRSSAPAAGLPPTAFIGTFGTLDADYRGEAFVTLYTTAADISYVVEDGDRIAQLVVTRLAEVEFAVRDELSETERGSGGHGSTGR